MSLTPELGVLCQIVGSVEINELRDALRMRPREFGQLVSSQRVSDQNDPADILRIEEGYDVLRQRCGVITGYRLRRFPLSPARETENVEAIRKVGCEGLKITGSPPPRRLETEGPLPFHPNRGIASARRSP